MNRNIHTICVILLFSCTFSPVVAIHTLTCCYRSFFDVSSFFFVFYGPSYISYGTNIKMENTVRSNLQTRRIPGSEVSFGKYG